MDIKFVFIFMINSMSEGSTFLYASEQLMQ